MDTFSVTYTGWCTGSLITGYSVRNRKSSDSTAGGKSVWPGQRRLCSLMVSEIAPACLHRFHWTGIGIVFGAIKCSSSCYCAWSEFLHNSKASVGRHIRPNKASFPLKDFCLTYKCAPSGREGSLMMHKESPPAKNFFLEDLDKLDVSVFRFK